jgi:hypothetical protein
MMARRSLLQHEVPDWDPMSADYYDPNFNNYAYGPGSRLDRHLQPCYTRYICTGFMLQEDDSD